MFTAFGKIVSEGQEHDWFETFCIWEPVSRVMGILPRYVPGSNREYSEQRKNECIKCLFIRQKESVSVWVCMCVRREKNSVKKREKEREGKR